MAKAPTIKPKDTLEAELRQVLDRTDESDETVEVPRWLLKIWAGKAGEDGMSLEQEQRAAVRVREMLEARDATIAGLRQLVKELRLELGRYMDVVDADGDGTA